MRLTWRDAVATLAVGAAAGFYLLGVTGTVVQSARVAGVVVFALGVVACSSARTEMERIYGVGGAARPAMIYVVTASTVGAIALVAGIVTLVTAGEVALATLVASLVLLWLLATFRHAFTEPPTRSLTEHTPHGSARVGV